MVQRLSFCLSVGAQPPSGKQTAAPPHSQNSTKSHKGVPSQLPWTIWVVSRLYSKTNQTCCLSDTLFSDKTAQITQLLVPINSESGTARCNNQCCNLIQWCSTGPTDCVCNPGQPRCWEEKTHMLQRCSFKEFYHWFGDIDLHYSPPPFSVQTVNTDLIFCNYYLHWRNVCCIQERG